PVDVFDRHGRHFYDRPQGVRLTAALHAKEADGVRLIQVDGDSSPEVFTQNAVLRRVARVPQHYVVRERLPGLWQQFEGDGGCERPGRLLPGLCRRWWLARSSVGDDYGIRWDCCVCSKGCVRRNGGSRDRPALVPPE